MASIEELVNADDRLRPQTTFGYKKEWTSSGYDFPKLYLDNTVFPVKSWEPIDTYSEDHNLRFQQRYGKKNPE